MIELFDGVYFKCALGAGVTDGKLIAIEDAVSTLSDCASVGVIKDSDGYRIYASASGFRDNWTKKDYDAISAIICDIVGVKEVEVNPQRGSFLVLAKDRLPDNEKSYTYCASDIAPFEDDDIKDDANEADIPTVKEERERRAKRRKAGKKHEKRLKNIADSKRNNSATSRRHILSPWFDDEKGHVVMPNRGKKSKYLKKQANKKTRKTPLATKGNSHKKAFSYINNLI